MFWNNKKEYQDYYNEGFLLAVFEPEENYKKLLTQFKAMKPTNSNHTAFKAKMAGFMAGFEQRHKSRISLLNKAKQLNKDQEKER